MRNPTVREREELILKLYLFGSIIIGNITFKENDFAKRIAQSAAGSGQQIAGSQPNMVNNEQLG